MELLSASAARPSPHCLVLVYDYRFTAELRLSSYDDELALLELSLERLMLYRFMLRRI